MKQLTPKQKKTLLSVLSAVLLLLALFSGKSLPEALALFTGGSPNTAISVTPAPTATLKPTDTPAPTATLKPTDTPVPTATLKPTDAPVPTATTKPTATPAPTATTKPTATPAPTATTKPTATPAPTATTKPTATPAPGLDEDGSYTSREEVALYLHTYGRLPGNFITKKEAEALGWVSSKGNLWEVTDHKSIGGDRFGNYEGQLPKKKGRIWYECDINYQGGRRGSQRILFSDDGLIYYTDDHYETFTRLY